MARRFVAIAALLAASCGAPPPPASAKFWNAADLKRLGRGVESRGAPLRFLSPPYAAAATAQESAFDGLTVFPSFSEGQPAAYVTTEEWEQFPAVWIQPLYVPVQAFVEGGVKGYADFDAVFSVDATSRFYSPYWQIFYFETDKPKAFWTSAKQILDAGVPLREGPGKFCAIVPRELRPARAQGDVPRRPLSGEITGDSPVQGHAYVDGHEVWFFDLGVNRFTWDRRTGVVDETALFRFVRQGEVPIPTELPTVGGTGGYRAGRSCPAECDPAQFGALWRVYDVLLPASAGVYVPPSMPDLVARLQAQGLLVPDPAAPVHGSLGKESVLRVALNGAECFADASKCRWLDSQAALEQALPDWRFTKTDRLVSCPFLLFAGKRLGQ